MRTVYREQMDHLGHDLILMCDHIHGMNESAAKALFDANLEAAESVLSGIDHLDELRLRCEERAIELLSLEAPVARDLRQIVSGIYIVEDLTRMGSLSVHIANIARRRHPEKALPERVEGFLKEMARNCDSITKSMREILITYDVDLALSMARQDDAVDDIHQHLATLTTSEDRWPYNSRVTVDVTLLSRYFERYADHAVEVSSRMVYLATGYKPAEYLERQQSHAESKELQKRLETLERNFSR
ncbi:phosphate signaling complex protein PhoU [Corynebacterium sp. TAE3-ERU12]|uniref:phosphate signaling complex protein PhoU n=1 Tax=Corynebacterium sp. TAE3-ERU12 TaxID=2849491 RepID=UPI001C4404A6|nr:phosphate signaling complex protein PhoU [Corynebacterium sp. TAE3-ERU12]MBV7295845.1 phosphate signaling complex protein PhoU [Corynebacterium sp. TAE3-ERU12]